MNRYKVEREHGSDYKVVDTKTLADKATGLTHEEADETAKKWNAEIARRDSKFVTF